MIGKLKGIIDTVSEDTVLIDVGGVGYVAFCSAHTLRILPPAGQAAVLWIETHVREDHIHLYGFATTEEKMMFLQLTKVNGVGNKMALAILSTLTPQQVVTAISAEDKPALTAAPGVGPKLALRIITELKEKLVGMSVSSTVMPGHAGASTQAEANGLSDAISALINLGYNRSDAYTAVNKAFTQHQDNSVDVLIREGLRTLTKVS